LVTPHRAALLIPAVFSDALYAPVAGFAFKNFTMTFIVMVMLLLQWVLFTKTRMESVVYGLEKK